MRFLFGVLKLGAMRSVQVSGVGSVGKASGMRLSQYHEACRLSGSHGLSIMEHLRCVSPYAVWSE